MFKKILASVITFLIFISTNISSQVRSGRGYDYFDDYGGDGGYFAYFLIIFWGIVLSISIIKILYDEFIENYKNWFKAILRILKYLLFISFVVGIYIFSIYLFVELDIQIPIYLEYLGRFLMAIFWLILIKYIFFKDVSQEEIYYFLKKPHGLLVSFIIILFILIMMFG